MRKSMLSLLFLGVLCCLSCSREPSNPLGSGTSVKEISLTYLGEKSLFGVVVNEYRVDFELEEVPVDSVEVVVIENGSEFIYGSLALANNRGVIENLKVPEFVQILHVDFFNDNGVEIREREVIQLP